MKRYLSFVLTLLIAFCFPFTASAAKPSGGGGSGKTFSAKISITSSSTSVFANEPVTITANWSSTLGINRTEWYIDGAEQTETLKSLSRDTTKGQSTFIFTGTEVRDYTLKFRIWKEGDPSRDTFQIFTVNVKSPEIRYVSLGDSIATGTTTPVTADTLPYSDQFETYLRDSSPGVNVIRSEFEADGDRTNELYDKLGLGDFSSTAVTDQNLINAVENADVITLSIGGNNLMQACKTGNWLQPYDFFNPDIDIANQGYADFMNQYDDIVAKIYELNSDAVVIVMTQYNPYNTTDQDMHNLVDGYFIGSTASNDGMNDLINGLADTYHYSIADVYTEFDRYNTNMGAVTLLYPDSLTRNPHPNQYGQNLIEGLHVEQYELLN